MINLHYFSLKCRYQVNGFNFFYEYRSKHSLKLYLHDDNEDIIHDNGVLLFLSNSSDTFDEFLLSFPIM